MRTLKKTNYLHQVITLLILLVFPKHISGQVPNTQFYGDLKVDASSEINDSEDIIPEVIRYDIEEKKETYQKPVYKKEIQNYSPPTTLKSYKDTLPYSANFINFSWTPRYYGLLGKSKDDTSSATFASKYANRLELSFTHKTSSDLYFTIGYKHDFVRLFEPTNNKTIQSNKIENSHYFLSLKRNLERRYSLEFKTGLTESVAYYFNQPLLNYRLESVPHPMISLKGQFHFYQAEKFSTNLFLTSRYLFKGIRSELKTNGGIGYNGGIGAIYKSTYNEFSIDIFYSIQENSTNTYNSTEKELGIMFTQKFKL